MRDRQVGRWSHAPGTFVRHSPCRTRDSLLVVWSSSAGPASRCGAPRFTRHPRAARIRRRIGTGVLFTVFGLMGLARAVRACRGARLLLAGAALTVAGSIV